MGIPLDVGSREAVAAECAALVGVGGVIFTPNVLMLERAQREACFAELLSHADILTVDGVGVKAALALSGIKSEALAGVELGEYIVASGAPSLALIGGREGVGERAFSYLKSKNLNIEKSFVISGYGYSEEHYLTLLAKRRPDICFVCLGSPRQEAFALAASRVSPGTLFLALGGSLDVYSGERRRAPRVMRRLGGEWLWRMACEPRRVRELSRLFSFAVHALTEAKNPQKSGRIKGDF
jgi:N-acetylglucosaminyldiphosphoundecaprenol N-acetyl-beta-D-mannosaminyltransferase